MMSTDEHVHTHVVEFCAYAFSDREARTAKLTEEIEREVRILKRVGRSR